MLACLVLGGLWPARALAVIAPVTAIDGPSADLISLGGTAVSEDGTGGIVYLKRVNGRAHVFAAQFAGGHWSPAEQVDSGQIYDSSFPAIAAGDNGRLLVVWAQPYAANVDRLYFSVLQPGATGFGPPHVADPNIGTAKYLHPSIAMNRGGQALLVYHVVYNDQAGGNLPSGYVQGDIRLARFDGSFFSLTGTPLERNVDQPQRTPTAANSPQVGIGYDGQGVVAWQEPDDNFHDRIWLRRIYGGSVSNVLEASPTAVGLAPLNGDADAFSLHVTPFDAAVVALRQEPPADHKLFTRARAYVNQLPGEFDPRAFSLEGARAIDGAGADGPPDGVGTPVVGSAGDGTWDVTYGSGTASLDVSGDESSVAPPVRLDGGSGVPGNPLGGRADSGAGDFAWTISGGIGVLERDPDGTPTQQNVFVPTGGTIQADSLAVSDLGDGVLGFLQGLGAAQTVAATTINAPPGAFTVSTPPTWVNSRSVGITWDPAPHGMSAVSYSVLLDDQDIADNLTGTTYRLSRSVLPDGVHTVSVTATDTNSQTTDSATAVVQVDRTGPRARLARRRRTVTVRVSDGPHGQVSGVSDLGTTVNWGDGARSTGTSRLSHRYRHGGRFTLRISTSDNAGNAVRYRYRVRL